HYVFRVAWALLGEDAAAEDAVQDVFLKMQSGRLKAKPRARFTTWLYQVTLNTAREQARDRRKVWGHARAETALSDMADKTADPVRLETMRDLGRSLATLPLRQREVVVLRFLEGFDTAETAEILGCREGTVKAHLHRATLKLRDLLATREV
ncbi:MAG: sigma-70 family RNA polymerase sigma factor, partial [Pseudomonadota bacterium]